MSQQVHVLPEDTIKEMKAYYRKYLQSTPPGAVFRAKTKQAVITAYKSGKVLFQGSIPDKEAAKWAGEKSSINTPQASERNRKQASSFGPPADLFTSNHIGSDEAGTGDYFGPITVAACYIPKDKISILKELGIKDSKNLTDPIIKKLSKEIIKLGIPYSLLVLHNEKYNKLQKQAWSQGKMKAILHDHAITNLMKKIEGKQLDGILIDQFCEPAVYKRHLASESRSIAQNTYFMTKAESYSIAVAAASIIARTSFVDKMDQLSQKLEIDLPKGASNKVDQAIAAVIQKHGSKMLDHCAKVHFANTKKAEKYL